MFTFYLTKGHTIDELVNLSAVEKVLMHHAMEEYLLMMERMVDGIVRGGEDNR